MRLRRPSHATLIAYLALFVALGGTVYAASAINGKEIKRHSTPGNRLKSNSVTGKQVKESSLNASGFLPSGGAVGHPCGATSPIVEVCAHTTLHLRRPSRVVAIGNGSWSVVVPQAGPPYDLGCSLVVDGKKSLGAGQQSFGVGAVLNSSDAGMPVALAGTSKEKIRAGEHKVQLRCESDSGIVRGPTITAFAISSG